MNLIQVFKMLSILLFLSFTKIKANSVNNLPTNLEILWIKFGLSEKHTQFEKIFLMVWTFTKGQLILNQNCRAITSPKKRM